LIQKYPKSKKFIGPIYVKVRQWEQNRNALLLREKVEPILAKMTKLSNRKDENLVGYFRRLRVQQGQEPFNNGMEIIDSEYFGSHVPIVPPEPTIAEILLLDTTDAEESYEEFKKELPARKVKKELPRPRSKRKSVGSRKPKKK
jgi:hypothetical protein